MLRLLLTHLGHHFLKQSGASRALDWKLGLRLMRDRRVSASTKALAVGLGIGAMAVLQVLELPVESALALLVPVLGFAGDLALDGIEAVAVPFLVSTLLLPFLAPAAVVAELRGETEPQPVPVPGTPPRSSGFATGHVSESVFTLFDSERADRAQGLV